MSNIIPEHTRRELGHWYEARMVGSLAGMMFVLALCFAGMIVPIYHVVATRTVPHDAMSREERGDPHVVQDLQHTAAILKDISANATSTQVLAALQAALAVRPSGIVITNIRYQAASASQSSNGEGSLVIDGYAKDRSLLDLYTASLERDTHFATVTVPARVLAGIDDGNITITLTGAF